MYQLTQRFRSPFPINHCVPLALAELRDGGPQDAIRIAQAARKRGLLSPRGSAILAGDIGYRNWWFRWADLLELRRIRLPHQTLGRFALAEGRVGRWLILTAGHAVAVIDGRILGWYKPRTRIQSAIQVQPMSLPSFGGF